MTNAPWDVPMARDAMPIPSAMKLVRKMVLPVVINGLLVAVPTTPSGSAHLMKHILCWTVQTTLVLPIIVM